MLDRQKTEVLSLCKNKALDDQARLSALQKILESVAPDQHTMLLNSTDDSDEYKGATPLIHLSAEGSIECIQFLLSKNVNLHARDETEGWDALTTALECGQTKTAQFIAIHILKQQGISIYFSEQDPLPIQQYQLLRTYFYLLSSKRAENQAHIHQLVYCFSAFDLDEPTAEKTMYSITSQEKSQAHAYPVAIPALSEEMKSDPILQDADDSSDEEDSELRNQYYPDINNPENALLIPGYVMAADPEHYSYLIHLMSVKRFHHSAVHEKYYAFKKTLPESRLFSTDQELGQWIYTSVCEMLGSACSRTQQSGLGNELAAEFFKENESFLNEKIHTALRGKSKRALLRQINNPELLDDAVLFVLAIQDEIKRYINRLPDSIQNRFTAPPHLIEDDFYRIIQIHVEERLRATGFLGQNNKFCSVRNRPVILPPLGFPDNLIIPEAQKTTGSTSWNSFNDSALCRSIYENLIVIEIQRGAQSLLIKTDTKFTFRTDAPIDLHAMMQRMPFSMLFRGQNPVRLSLLNKYLPFTLERLKKELLEDVQKYFTPAAYLALLQKNSQAIKLERGLPPNQALFRSNNFVEFLANIRLAMRIQKRRIRQARTDQESASDIEKIAFQAAWQFGDLPTLALEEQRISIHAARTDLVINLGSYAEISRRLATFNAYSKNIADWIFNSTIFNRATLRAKFTELNIPPKIQRQLEELIPHLVYLLLGCEVQRNPSAYLTHMMAIDLIQQGFLTWNEALSKKEYETQCAGGEMPMSMGKYVPQPGANERDSSPVKCARVLQRYYGFFSIKRWQYAGEEANEQNQEKAHITELVRRENAITKKWLRHNGHDGKPVAEKLDALKGLSMKG